MPHRKTAHEKCKGENKVSWPQKNLTSLAQAQLKGERMEKGK